MSMCDAEEALRALGGRAYTGEIRAYLIRERPKFAHSGLTRQLRRLEARRLIRPVGRCIRGRPTIWEFVA
jgi:hypothetical protein